MIGRDSNNASIKTIVINLFFSLNNYFRNVCFVFQRPTRENEEERERERERTFFYGEFVHEKGRIIIWSERKRRMRKKWGWVSAKENKVKEKESKREKNVKRDAYGLLVKGEETKDKEKDL